MLDCSFLRAFPIRCKTWYGWGFFFFNHSSMFFLNPNKTFDNMTKPFVSFRSFLIILHRFSIHHTLFFPLIPLKKTLCQLGHIFAFLFIFFLLTQAHTRWPPHHTTVVSHCAGNIWNFFSMWENISLACSGCKVKKKFPKLWQILCSVWHKMQPTRCQL